jgi:hypothetical protein
VGHSERKSVCEQSTVFRSIMKYGIIFWGNLPEVFLLPKETVRIITGIQHRSICRPAFKTLNILTLALKYVLPLMTFMINNLEHFTFNCAIHNLTRHRGNLHVLQLHLSLRQKGVHYVNNNF